MSYKQEENRDGKGSNKLSLWSKVNSLRLEVRSQKPGASKLAMMSSNVVRIAALLVGVMATAHGAPAPPGTPPAAAVCARWKADRADRSEHLLASHTSSRYTSVEAPCGLYRAREVPVDTTNVQSTAAPPRPHARKLHAAHLDILYNTSHTVSAYRSRYITPHLTQ